jgi:hypothetical protein
MLVFRFKRYPLTLLRFAFIFFSLALPASVWSESTLTTMSPQPTSPVSAVTAEANSSSYVSIPTTEEQTASCQKQRKRLERLNRLWAPVGFVVSPYRAWAQAEYSQCLVTIAKQNQRYLQSIPANRPSIRIEED